MIAMKYNFIRAMPGRDLAENHRPSTSLELFFDLVSVIAIAAAANGLHHAITEHHFADGMIKYFISFFAIWWAWMNFTWFASAYDNDDVPYRIAVMIMMVGALIIAAGIPPIFANLDLSLGVIGYVVMRLALVSLWLRAAKHDPERRKTTQKHAAGITMCQTVWILGYFLVPPSWFLPFIGFAVICELMVPYFAEKPAGTTWHRDHIIERYGLFTIIVLGESLLALSNALVSTTDISLMDLEVHLLIAGGLLTVFSMWWLYFSELDHKALDGTHTEFVWGYGHYLIFASIAAVGAGLAVQIDFLSGHSEISEIAANAALSIPVAIYALSLWIVHEQFHKSDGADRYLLPGTALVVLMCTYLSFAPLAIGVVFAICLALRLRIQARRAVAGSGGEAN